MSKTSSAYDHVCCECGRPAFERYKDKLYCYRCLDTVKDEEYQREIDQEEGR